MILDNWKFSVSTNIEIKYCPVGFLDTVALLSIIYVALSLS